MFPRLRHQLLARLDVAVELVTLGEYGLDERGAPLALDPEPVGGSPVRVRDRCGADPAPRRCATAPGRGAGARP